MKKLISLLALVSSIAVMGAMFTGCGDDKKDSSSSSSSSSSSQAESSEEAAEAENSEEEAAAGIVGSWEYETGGYTYTFNADGTGTYDVGSGDPMKFTYTEDGTNLSILYDGNTAPFESTYSIDGNKLNIKDSFGSDTIYIKK